MMFRHLSFVLIFALFTINAQAQGIKVPPVYSNIHSDANGVYLQHGDVKIYEETNTAIFTLDKIEKAAKGTKSGFDFDFHLPEFSGLLYYGFINLDDSKHPLPVYYKSPAVIEGGKCSIDILKLKGKYDMIGWESSRKGLIGYRLLNEKGEIIYDGKLGFTWDDVFIIDITLLEGPSVHNICENNAVISFRTNVPIQAKVEVNGKIFKSDMKFKEHEIQIEGLLPDKTYSYNVIYGDNSQTYHFKTAARTGSTRPFKFAYASDCRNGMGGGERGIYGTNAYIMKKIMALATQEDAQFMQFTGDLVTGYVEDIYDIELQYANFRIATEAFTHYIPMYTGMGNHESVSYNFPLKGFDHGLAVNRFPFQNFSSEAVFANNMVNPKNTKLISEDGAAYDPNLNAIDFPNYSETVYSYVYGNMAMIVLNSNYWYAPSLAKYSQTSGGLHGYIMDNQLDWLKSEVAKYESNEKIAHIFVTIHTPPFPNGGHVSDCMWYSGNNEMRPIVAGKPVEKGIIERRDEILDLLVNKSSKFRAFLTGDEHNYAKTLIEPNTNIYPPNYTKPKITLSRSIWQINNGSAGAPYYAQERTPWSPAVQKFSTQNALVIFEVDGERIMMRVKNPDTLEIIDEGEL